MRGHLARNELGSRINAAEQTTAKNTLSSSIKKQKSEERNDITKKCI